MSNTNGPTNEKDNKAKTTEAKKAEVTNNKNTQTIVIAVLATALTCFVIVFAVLLCTGTIKFTDGDRGDVDKPMSHRSDDGKRAHPDDNDELVDNPYERVSAKGNLVEVDDLEFYLPSAFKAGGKNKDGAYTYNLEDDDGWAQVLVYVEKSNLSPAKFLNKISSYLEFSDDDYEINGTEWVEAENGNALAYATKLDGKIYAVYYSVKLDSEATGEAMQMIPKTLYMKKIERD